VLVVGDNLDGWAPPVCVRRGKARGLAGPGGEAGQGRAGGSKKERELAGLGRKAEKERGKKKKREWVGPK
jgi:hypothetical protein